MALEVSSRSISLSGSAPRDRLIAEYNRPKHMVDAFVDRAVIHVGELAETCALDVVEERSPMTLEEVGQLFGVSRERVRQIEEKALRKVEKALGHEGDAILELLARDNMHPLARAQEVQSVSDTGDLARGLKRFERTDDRYGKSLEGKQARRAVKAGKRGGKRGRATQERRRRREEP